MSLINILAITPDQHGVGKFRILDPYKYLGINHTDEVFVDISLDAPDQDELFEKYHIVVFHTFIHKKTHEDNIRRVKWLKSKGIKVIMDIDDLWFVDQRHPMFHQIRVNKIGEKKLELLKLVDWITTTTPIFAQTIKDKLRLTNVAVFPNAIDENDSQFIPKPIKSDRIRFGWLGGSSHEADISLLDGTIQSILEQHKDNVQFVLCGFDLRGSVTEMNKETGEMRQRPMQPMETVWFRYENVFTGKYKSLDEEYKQYLLKFTESPFDDTNKPYIRRWTRDINTYASNYNYFDVSLAPLVGSEFNSNKSQLKAIESGFHKKALIASEVKPYTLDLVNAVTEGVFNNKGNALLVPPSKNHKEWMKHMTRLIKNPNMIEDLGNRLYETVKDKYSLKKVSKDRVEFFKSIINN